MRRFALIPALLAGLGLGFLPAGANPLPSDAGTCGPSFLEIYDFQVGDVFQYRETFELRVSSTQSEWKYTIVSKEPLVGGFRYRIDGFVKNQASGPPPTPPATSGRFSTNVDIIDSTARQSLNACPDAIVNMFDPWNQPLPVKFPATGNFTRVHIAVGDSVDFPLSTDATKLKILGGPAQGFPGNNLFADPAGKDSLNQGNATGEFPNSAVYAAGLGEVSGRKVGVEGGGVTRIRLEGYIRNGIKHGLIDPDNAFVGVAARLKPAKETLTAYILRFTADGRLILSTEGTGMRDLIGRQAPFPFSP